ncbi:MAG TPA: hypothetical protein VGF84_05595 [Micromonosporaceae bacterium]
MPRRILLVALAALVLAAAACSSGTSGSGTSAKSGLAAAMASVSGTGSAAQYFEYGDLATMRRLGILRPTPDGSAAPIDHRWIGVVGLGGVDLITYSKVLHGLIDLNVLTGGAAIAIGNPPNDATRIDGAQDRKAVLAKLTALGAKPRSFGGTAGLSFGPDNSIDLSGKLSDPKYGTLGLHLRQIAVTDNTFAVSANGATLEKVLAAGDRSLLDTPHFQGLADCLGDVVGAIVLADPAIDTRAALVGIGVRTPVSAGGTVDDVLCILPKPGDQDSVHQSLTQRLAPHATDPISHQPLSTYVSKTAVDNVGGLVRAVLTLKSTAPAGYLIEGVERNLASYWDGSCASVPSGQC